MDMMKKRVSFPSLYAGRDESTFVDRASLDSDKRLILRIHGVGKIKVNAWWAGLTSGWLSTFTNLLCATRRSLSWNRNTEGQRKGACGDTPIQPSLFYAIATQVA